MPILRVINRERGLDRDRVRPNAPGNFITFTKGGTIYYVLFQPTIQHYIKYQLYSSPYPKAFGYHDEPAPDPPLRLLGPAADPQSIVPNDILSFNNPDQIFQPNQPINEFQPNITPAPYIPPAIGPDTSKVQNQATNPGKMFVFVPGTSPKQIFGTALPVTEVLVKADEDNIDDVWIGYDPGVSVGNGWRLVSGAGLVLFINDISKVYLIAKNLTDSVQVIYNT